MKKYSYVILILLVALVSSCRAPKNVAYLQNSDYVDLSSEYLYDAKIMPKDILTITVSTVNPEAAAPFNLTVSTALNIQTRSTNSQPALQTYLVDNAGMIDFPVLGRLAVGGLTKSECEKLIHDKIMPYLNANENPVVTVRMSSYSISVLGEVARPGSYQVSREKINILEALAQAGDLTIYGVRDNVKLIRENAKGHKEIHTINLNDANLLTSPFYYLQQNDIVYVEPNKVKSRNSTIGQSTTLWISATSILISMASLLYNILK
ncbi:MAG: polysaccharide biosynthesis/export family protein [Prevotella sp.]|nr:polysaccharide biosynthesis/export family protein [Prevotella sp.]